jgi:glycerophosphoryl diester phosphodiesterase
MRLDLFCLLSLVVTVTLGGCSVPPIQQEGGASTKCAVVVAHRAGAREAAVPDNSLAAIEAAVSDGLDILEVDVRWSADGKSFLFHDRRLPGAPWHVPSQLIGQPLSSLAAADLERICAPSSQQSCLLPFSTALDSLGRETTALQVDLKGKASRTEVVQIVSDIQRRELSERVILFCDPLAECELVRDVTSVIRIMARVHEENDLTKLLTKPPWAVQVDENMLGHQLLADLRKNGVLVMVKTLDDAGDTVEHWSLLRKKGVDLVLTDYPRAARRTLCPQ